jgi:N-acetylglutamate synthase-like GNAT family acetyltransferase
MIREANRYDIPILLDMVREYNKEVLIKANHNVELHDPQYVSNLLFTIIKCNGFILIDDDMNGFLVAIKMKNIWFPKMYELHELAWWVDVDHRNGSLGGKLWLEFNKKANQLLDNKEINVIYTSLMVNSPEIDCTKRGFKMIETKYFKE